MGVSYLLPVVSATRVAGFYFAASGAGPVLGQTVAMRFNRKGSTRLIWSSAQIGSGATRSLASLDAATDLTANVADVSGVGARARVKSLGRGAGAHVESQDNDRPLVLKMYDEASGGADRAVFSEQTAQYGYLYLITDAVNGAGAVGSRLQEFKVSTMGPVDDINLNVSTFSITFAVISWEPGLEVAA
jgi:hypothetical protein